MLAAPRLCCLMLLSTSALIGGCTSETGDHEAASGSSAPPVTTPAVPPTPTPSPAVGAGPYRPGDCVEVVEEVVKVDCASPHEYEVMHSDELPADVPDDYPPPVATMIRPNCTATLPTYLDSPDAEASRLEPLAFWPTQAQWDDGDRWFACLVVERSPDNQPVRRTGMLAGVLASGLGQFQRCLVEEPLEDPLEVVPCSQAHRSEAAPGVLVLGEPTDPPPSIDEMIDLSLDHCVDAVDAYLGGDQPDVVARVLTPLPEDWETGETAAVCYAVAEAPVTGPIGGR